MTYPSRLVIATVSIFALTVLVSLEAQPPPDSESQTAQPTSTPTATPKRDGKNKKAEKHTGFFDKLKHASEDAESKLKGASSSINSPRAATTPSDSLSTDAAAQKAKASATKKSLGFDETIQKSKAAFEKNQSDATKLISDFGKFELPKSAIPGATAADLAQPPVAPQEQQPSDVLAAEPSPASENTPASTEAETPSGPPQQPQEQSDSNAAATETAQPTESPQQPETQPSDTPADTSSQTDDTAASPEPTP